MLRLKNASSKEVYIDLSTYLMWYFAHNFAKKTEMKTFPQYDQRILYKITDTFNRAFAG